jgi:hypothetical protein
LSSCATTDIVPAAELAEGFAEGFADGHAGGATVGESVLVSLSVVICPEALLLEWMVEAYLLWMESNYSPPVENLTARLQMWPSSIAAVKPAAADNSVSGCNLQNRA